MSGWPWFRPKPPTPPVPLPLRTVAVIVRDPAGANVNQARVELDDTPRSHTAFTVDGLVTFSGIPASLVQSHLWVSAEDYVPVSVSLALPSTDVQVWLGGDPAQPTAIRLPALVPVDAVTMGWPRHAASYYTSLTDPRIDPAEFAARLRDLGCDGTRVWLIDAWAVGQGTGCYEGYHPWTRGSKGVWDLDVVSQPYLDRLRAYVEAMNAHGILPLLSGWELYSWSDRKQGMLWVPDASTGPFRTNRQGLVYGDDAAFEVIATGGVHRFLEQFYRRVVETLNGLSYEVELANEMPEKALHYRLRDAWRAAGYTGNLTVNRNEDTPGQHDNMRIGQDFEGISFHGQRDIGYLDEVYADEPTYQTFRAFYDTGSYDSWRLALSSDGCRKSTNVEDAYDYPALEAVFVDALARGFGYEHQLALKLRGFTHGYVTLDDLQYDAPLLRALSRAAGPVPPA